MSRKLKWFSGCPSGFVSAGYHPQGDAFFLASSSKSSLWMVKGDKLNSPQELEVYHEEGIWDVAVSSSGQWVVTCSADHTANMYNFKKSMKRERLIERFESPVYAVAISQSEDLLALAGADGVIKLQPMHDSGPKNRLLRGHTGSVKSLAFDPLREYLASAGSDGSVRIWKYGEKDEQVVSLDLLPPTDARTDRFISTSSMSRLQWHPNGDYLAVPTADGISIVERPETTDSDWEVAFNLSEQGVKETTVVRWSVNGKYLVSAHVDGNIYLWDVEGNESLDRRQHTSPATSLSWHPKANDLLIATQEGTFALWSDVVDLSKLQTDGTSEAQKYTKKKSSLNNLFDDEAIDDADEGEKEEEEYTEATSDGCAASDDVEKRKKKKKSFAPKSDDNLDYSESREYRPKFEKVIEVAKAYEDMVEEPAVTKHADSVGSIPPLQQPFQVNSNPFQGDLHQYLAWNEVGKITVRYETTTVRNGQWATESGIGSVGGSTIKIDFNDMDKHKGIKRSEIYAVSHAALSDEAYILADQEAINFHRISGSWASDTDWIVKLPVDEFVEALCNECVAVSTSKKFIRIYSLGGVQTNVFYYSHVVTMIGQGSLLCIVFMNGYQNYRFAVHDMKKKKVLFKGHLPIRDHAVLAWIGFTDENILAAMDSDGTLSLYDRKGIGIPAWVPVFIPTHEIPDNIWPVQIFGEKLAYVSTLEEKAAPAVHPPPVPKIVTLSVPSSQQGTEEAVIRDTLIWNATKDHMDEQERTRKRLATVERPLITLFVEACTNDKGQRAMDIAKILQLPASLRAAIQIATQRRQTELATRIQVMLAALEAGRTEQSDEEDYEERKRSVKRQKTNSGAKATKTITISDQTQSDDESEGAWESEREDEEEEPSKKKAAPSKPVPQPKNPNGAPFKSYTPVRPTGDLFSSLTAKTAAAAKTGATSSLSKASAKKQSVLPGAKPAAYSPAKGRGRAKVKETEEKEDVEMEEEKEENEEGEKASSPKTGGPKQRTLTGKAIVASSSSTRGRKRKQGQ